jgi:hypothetical protein
MFFLFHKDNIKKSPFSTISGLRGEEAGVREEEIFLGPI